MAETEAQTLVAVPRCLKHGMPHGSLVQTWVQVETGWMAESEIQTLVGTHHCQSHDEKSGLCLGVPDALQIQARAAVLRAQDQVETLAIEFWLPHGRRIDATIEIVEGSTAGLVPKLAAL